MNKRKRTLIIGLAFLLILSCRPSKTETLPTTTPIPPTEAPEEAPDSTSVPDDLQLRRDLLRSTVQIFALMESEGKLQPIWSGSGTIISPDGLILTNAHVATDPNPEYQPDALGVAITVRSDTLPELQYLAKIRAVDNQLDLAVIQITTDLNGRPVDVDELNMTHVSLGDSDVLELGDMVQILGYPGIGGETITFTEGVVSGFTRERGVEGRAYVKTDATIAGGNSGGLAANQEGKIVGVPTQVGYGGANRFADCRYLADTNNDGVINESDNCIPVGGFINALRPVNLAKPLIEAARAGIAPKAKPGPKPSKSPSSQASFSNLVFAPDVTENDQPTQIATQLPSGATGVYAFWNYDGMAEGMTWEARWYYDGQYLEDVSWPSAPWQGDEQGSWWIAVTNESGLTDGTYKLELFAQEEMLVQGSISIGGEATEPAITNLVFSDDVTDDDGPTNPTYLLPSGITKVYAFFDFDKMSDGMAWSRIWTYEGERVLTGSDTWSWGNQGSAWTSASRDEPVDPGAYRLEVSVEGDLVADSDFTIAGDQAKNAIGPITFASGVDATGGPVGASASFPTGLEELHFFCDYTGMQNGMNVDEKWVLNGKEIATFDILWEQGESGTLHDYIYRSSGDPLNDGEYRVELYVEEQLVQEATTTIGTGAPPATPAPPTEGLFIQGYIRDADTGSGISGAIYVVLKPGVTTDDWDGNEEQIYTWAKADANGYFELPLPLERGQSYSIAAWAEGYLIVTGDDVPIGNDPSPLDVEVTLQRE